LNQINRELLGNTDFSHYRIVSKIGAGAMGDVYLAQDTKLDRRVAYQLYLKGHYYASRYTKEGFNKGIEYFDQAIAKDPNFALAYNGLAFCYLNQTDWVFAPRDSVPKARQAVENALRIDDTHNSGQSQELA
jgi:serine/threonine protein kinase